MISLEREQVSDIKGIEFAKKMNYKFYLSSAKDNPQGFINFLEELIKDFLSEKYGFEI